MDSLLRTRIDSMFIVLKQAGWSDFIAEFSAARYISALCLAYTTFNHRKTCWKAEGREPLSRLLQVPTSNLTNSAFTGRVDAAVTAATLGDAETFKRLPALGIYINQENNNGASPLIAAVRYGPLDMVLFLLAKGVTVVWSDGGNPDSEGNPHVVWMAACERGDLKILDIMEYRIHDLGSWRLLEPLYCANRFGNIEVLKHYVDRYDLKIYQNNANDYLQSCLLTAVSKGYMDIVRFMVERGLWQDIPWRKRRISAPTSYRPFMRAVERGRIDIVVYFIASGIDEKSLHYSCAVSGALKAGNSEMARILAEAGFPQQVGKHFEREGITTLRIKSWIDKENHI